MAPKHRSIPPVEYLDGAQTANGDDDERIPTKAEVLEDIREGYRFVRSGGEGQPIDEVHREIAEELAREAPAQNADVRQ